MKFFRSPIALSLIILLAVVGLYRLWSVFGDYRDLKTARAKLEEKLAFYEEEHKRLRQEIRLAHTAEAIERDAKSRLNQKLPGEKVVVVVSDATSTPEEPKKTNFWNRIAGIMFFWR